MGSLGDILGEARAWPISRGVERQLLGRGASGGQAWRVAVGIGAEGARRGTSCSGQGRAASEVETWKGMLQGMGRGKGFYQGRNAAAWSR